MAVYDGHGTDGHVCSQYAAKHLPLYVANNTRQWRVPNKKGGAAAAAVTRSRSLTAAEYEECCKKAFLECNNAMHKDKTVRMVTMGWAFVVFV